MPVTMKTQRNGTLRPCWYGVYTDGKRRVVNLNVPIRGTPHASLSLKQPGSEDFEQSRKEAEAELAKYVEDAARKGRSEHLTERLIASKTGSKVEYVRLDQMAQRWRDMGREGEPVERYFKACDAHFRRFADFMLTRNPSAAYLYEVTAKDAAAFMASCRATLAPATAKYCVRLINKAMSRFLPVGSANPFGDFVNRAKKGETGVIHRKPFTPTELQALFAAARADAFMYPLIVTAAMTGMRRGDVCGLKWGSVDLAGGMLAVKTHKTEAEVEVPIFPPLKAVLEAQKGRHGYVFPEAARMLADNANGLTWRFKQIVSRALSPTLSAPPPPVADVADVKAEALAAVDTMPVGNRRERIRDTFTRYCNGESVREIENITEHSRSTVSADLHAVEAMINQPFMRNWRGPDTKPEIIRLTRQTREKGQRAASVRDWHALRVTWVTLALSAGVPVELVKRVTGHATVDIVLEHYFRPGRDAFKAALVGSMPDVLTGGNAAKQSPAEELAALAGKIVAKTATDADKARLRKLAKAV